ncbi:MAG TPA: T9SS type A sorting domain-containing protein [Ignavibacteria bacterium]|jgi:hypothetical protein
MGKFINRNLIVTSVLVLVPLIPQPVFGNDNIVWTITELSPDARTQYDLQSNGNTNYIVQNPTNPMNMHACFMVATDPDPWNTRNTRYFYTTDGGTTWNYRGTVTTSRSGFPCLTMTTDGRAIILTHSSDGGGNLRTQIYIDSAPGAGLWSRFNPPGEDGFWPDAAFDRGSSKILFLFSRIGLVYNVCSSPPGACLGYGSIPNSAAAGQYACAINNDGSKYGIAYLTTWETTAGCRYIESTDDGVTWSSPVNVWTWNSADSLGTYRNVDLVYQGSVPKVVFGVGKVIPATNEFDPGAPSKMMLWSPNTNGGIPVVVDSSAGLTGSNPQNDGFFSVTRGVVGISNEFNFLFIAYNKARSDTSAEGNNFFDVWFRYSTNSGMTWSTKTQLTNNPVITPLKDCRYPSISPTNHSFFGIYQYAHIIVQADTVPGSNVNGAPPSIAKMLYIKVQISEPMPGVRQISSEIPAHYWLSQNFPNPFNPATKIRFALPKNSDVSINIYEITGRLVTVLVQNEHAGAGLYETDFNAENLASGIYYYSIMAGDFKETKKMVLIK